MKTNTKRGLKYTLIPLLPVIAALAAIAAGASMIKTLGAGYYLILTISTFVGWIGVVLILFFLPFGISLFFKKDDQEVIAAAKQNPLYQNLSADQILFIHKWSWSAYLFGFIWALSSKMYLWALGYLVPVFNIYVWLRLSAQGRKLSYEKGWASYEQFYGRQRAIKIAVIIITVLLVALPLLLSGFSILQFVKMQSQPSNQSYNTFINTNSAQSPSLPSENSALINTNTAEPANTAIQTQTPVVLNVYPVQFSLNHLASPFCTLPLVTADGPQQYIAPRLAGEKVKLGELFTALSCGGDRYKSLEFILPDGTYAFDSRITLRLPYSTGSNEDLLLKNIGYECTDIAIQGSCAIYTLNKKVPAVSLWPLLDIYDNISTEDCQNCG